jgi:phosphotransferase system HPr-like phosphotransfer protein
VASAIWKELDFAVETAWLLKDLGSVAKREGDVAKARALFSDGLAIGRESSDKGAIPALLNAIAAEVIDLKDYRQARMLYEESLAIQRECGKKEDVQWLRETLEHLPRRESRVLRGVAGRSLDSANEMTAGQGIRTEKHAPNVETAIAYVQIRNRFGIHHAPSALFVKTAGRYQCDITVEMVSAGQVPVSRDSNFNRYFQRDITVERVGETREESDFMGLDQVNGKSIMGLTMLQAGNGARLRITASGSGANKAVHELEELVERGFDEA